ncbi:MAG: adenylate/guanylate cyclase domain-containing protein [Acidobacteria bacterium]|nr:adenylate/guanylate cyclase domain-containing protein [Acidobacteriota bacterium]MBS1865567.1 adenylate/guanylate cyclase domain-containing protein [Acidobacteriota bacterium]
METNPQTQRAFRQGVYLAVALAGAIGLTLQFTRAGIWMENRAFDERARWSARPEKADPRIVIIDIDNASFDELQDKLGRWPWPRQVWTEIVRYVSKGQPAAIVFDAAFTGEQKEAPQMDDDFARILQNSGKTVLGFSFLSTDVSGNQVLRQDASVYAAPGARFGFELPKTEWTPNLPLDKLASAAAGLGSINSTADDGGLIRREPIYFVYQGRAYPTLGARTVEVATPQDKEGWVAQRSWLGTNSLARGGTAVPVDSEGRVLLLWHGRANKPDNPGEIETYKRIPLWEVICSIYPEQCPNVEHKHPASEFQGKIVMVGASAAGSYEPRPTPLDKQPPGFFAHATLMDNLLNGVAMREAPAWLAAALILLMSLIGGAIQLNQSSFRAGVFLISGALILFFVSNVALFGTSHFVLPLVAPSIALALSYSGASTARYVTTGRELRQTRGVLERYVAPQLVKYVMANIEQMQLNGDKRELTILMSDVRNFTTMTEKSEPMELIALLDDYLSAMTEIIFKYNGIVDKFIGDGILAYWGAFTPEHNHAMEASQAALEMIEKVKELNAKWATEGKTPISIGIGVNTGTVIFGNLGKGKKTEFTVIGDPVNLAARLESLNKEMHTSIIVSEETRNRLGNQAQVRALGGVKVKGKTIETTVYELCGWGTAPASEAAKKEMTEVVK